MSRRGTLLACVFAFAAGGLAMFAFLRLQHVSSSWFELTRATSPLTFSEDVAFRSDIALPDINEISGTAKFVPATDGSSSRKLGYLVQINVPSLDLRKVPGKYLVRKQLAIAGVKAYREPIKEVYYEVQLTFALKDRDGFTLAKLVSPSETVSSGKDNQLQNFATKTVTTDLAARTKLITLELYLMKCITCETE